MRTPDQQEEDIYPGPLNQTTIAPEPITTGSFPSVAVQEKDLSTNNFAVVQQNIANFLDSIPQNETTETGDKTLEIKVPIEAIRERFFGFKKVQFKSDVSQKIAAITKTENSEHIQSVQYHLENACNAYQYIFGQLPESSEVKNWISAISLKMEKQDRSFNISRWNKEELKIVKQNYFPIRGNEKLMMQQLNMIEDILISLENVGIKMSDAEVLPFLRNKTQETLKTGKEQLLGEVSGYLENQEDINSELVNKLSDLLVKQESKFLSEEDFDILEQAESQTKAVATIYQEAGRLGKKFSLKELLTQSKCLKGIDELFQALNSNLNNNEIGKIRLQAYKEVTQYINNSLYLKKLPQHSQEDFNLAINNYILKKIEAKNLSIVGSETKEFKIDESFLSDEENPKDVKTITGETLQVKNKQTNEATESYIQGEKITDENLKKYVLDYLPNFIQKLESMFAEKKSISNQEYKQLITSGLLEFQQTKILKPSCKTDQLERVLRGIFYEKQKKHNTSKQQKLPSPNAEPLKYSAWTKVMRNMEKVINAGDNPYLHQTNIEGDPGNILDINRKKPEVIKFTYENSSVTAKNSQPIPSRISSLPMEDFSIVKEAKPSMWSKVKSFFGSK